MRRLTAHSAALLTLVVAGAIGHAEPQRSAAAFDVFDRYVRAPDEVVRAIVARQDLQSVVEQLIADGPRWIDTAGEAARERRRRFAAVLALEIAHIGLDTPEQWPHVRRLVEWACVELRRGPPGDFERLWQLASIALLEGARDTDFLAGGETRLQKFEPAAHLMHAEQRFPREPRLQLARVLVRFESGMLSNRPGLLLDHWTRPGPGGSTPLEARRRAQRTLEDLDRLAANPSIAAEATLRSGILLFHVNELDAAVTRFQRSATGDDVFVAYLAHLMHGLTLDAQGRTADAVAAYDAAHRALPGARSAVFALAASLYVTNRAPAVAPLLQTAFARGGQFDPWEEFGFGDLRLWPSYLARLRSDVRP